MQQQQQKQKQIECWFPKLQFLSLSCANNVTLSSLNQSEQAARDAELFKTILSNPIEPSSLKCNKLLVADLKGLEPFIAHALQYNVEQVNGHGNRVKMMQMVSKAQLCDTMIVTDW